MEQRGMQLQDYNSALEALDALKTRKEAPTLLEHVADGPGALRRRADGGGRAAGGQPRRGAAEFATARAARLRRPRGRRRVLVALSSHAAGARKFCAISLSLCKFCELPRNFPIF